MTDDDGADDWYCTDRRFILSLAALITNTSNTTSQMLTQKNKAANIAAAANHSAIFVLIRSHTSYEDLLDFCTFAS